MLTSFEIRNFRAFSHLRVEKLGRVNLVVGKNNVGKTMFLEAVQLHALGAVPLALRNLLLERDEVVTDFGAAELYDAEFQLRVASLFHNRSSSLNGNSGITLGPTDGTDKIGIELRMIR